MNQQGFSYKEPIVAAYSITALCSSIKFKFKLPVAISTTRFIGICPSCAHTHHNTHPTTHNKAGKSSDLSQSFIKVLIYLHSSVFPFFSWWVPDSWSTGIHYDALSSYLSLLTSPSLWLCSVWTWLASVFSLVVSSSRTLESSEQSEVIPSIMSFLLLWFFQLNPNTGLGSWFE